MKELTIKQQDFLYESVNGEWHVNLKTGLVDVIGSVYPYTQPIKSGRLPVEFGMVTLDFAPIYADLTTLKGSPYHVGRHFHCYGNNLKSLKYAPRIILSEARVWGNPFEIIDWVPERVNELFFCLSTVKDEHMGIVIHGIEALIKKGISIYKLEEYYYPYRDAYCNRKLIEVL